MGITQIVNQNNVIGLCNNSNTNTNNSQYAAASNIGNTLIHQNAQILPEDNLVNTMSNLEWINKEWIQRIIRVCALLSFISICSNTPETFKKYRFVMILTYVVDMVTTIVFTVEMIAKIKIKRLFRGDNAYIFDRWCQFDGIMVIFHIISVVLQVNHY